MGQRANSPGILATGENRGKTDFKRQLDVYTAPRGRFAVVQVPPLTYLLIDGHGDPNDSPAYAEAVASLYSLAYGLKFLSKTKLGRDYVVMPLEGLWWSEDMASFTSQRDKSRWDWTLMNLVPDWLTAEQLEVVRRAAARKGSTGVDRVRQERYEEGLSVQTLHVGPFDEEAAVLAAMHETFLPARGLRRTGKHHEIYLSDPRRTARARLRTILRQPVSEREPAVGQGERDPGRGQARR